MREAMETSDDLSVAPITCPTNDRGPEEVRTWRGYVRWRRVGVEGSLGFVDVDWRGQR